MVSTLLFEDGRQHARVDRLRRKPKRTHSAAAGMLLLATVMVLGDLIALQVPARLVKK
jgi:hypothetical protein